jgi:hypothetical protein
VTIFVCLDTAAGAIHDGNRKRSDVLGHGARMLLVDLEGVRIPCRSGDGNGPYNRAAVDILDADTLDSMEASIWTGTSGHRSKSVEEFDGQQFDNFITVCDSARVLSGVFWRCKTRASRLRRPCRVYWLRRRTASNISARTRRTPHLARRIRARRSDRVTKVLTSTTEERNYFEALTAGSGFLSVVTGEGNRDPTGPVNSSFDPSS